MESLALASPNSAPAIPARYQKTRKESNLSFEQYLRYWAEYIFDEQSKLRKLTEMSVILHRRFRGLTISDLVSRYGVRPETQGVFLEYDPDQDGEVHPINIVQPAIRANTNACLQSNANINIESANASAKNKKIADRWQKVSDYFERIHWEEEERTILFDALQKDGTMLVRNYACSRDDLQTVPEIAQNSKAIAEFNCPSCGQQGRQELESTEVEEGEGQVECPYCQQPAIGKISMMQGFGLNEKQVAKTDIKQEFIPFYNFCIDSYNAKRKGIDSATWLQIQELWDRPKVESTYSQFEFGSPENYSYQIQCDYAIANQEWDKLNGMWLGRSLYPQFERFEHRKIYLHEEAYQNYVSPEDYSFVNAEGEETFNIKRGETIKEAQIRLYGENQKGFLFAWMDDQLRNIASPEEETLNFREQYRAIHWLRDSSGFHSSPNYSLVIIQDDITVLNTMNHNITAQAAVNPVFYNSLAFEESDFSKPFIGSKNQALLTDGDIRKAVTQFPVPTPSPYLTQQLQFLWQVKDSVSMVQPAQRGEQQKGETYGAQRQQLEQSYGQLTSPLKSFAQAKVGSTKQKFKICKQKWTLEEFQSVGSTFGELWTDEDVREMVECDLDRDLFIGYTEGSEMPQSNFTRELQFFQGLSQILPLIQANPELVGTDKIQKLLAKIDEYADFDFDVTGLEVMEVLAQKRVLEMQNLCADFAEMPLAQIDQAKQTIVGMEPTQMGVDELGQPIMGEQPITQFDLFLEQLFNQTDIRFNKYEDLGVQSRLFIEQLQMESGKEKPNWILVECLNLVLGMLEEAQRALQQEAIAKSPEMMLAEKEKAENLQHEKESAESEREHATETAATEREETHAENDKEFRRKMIEKKADHEAAKELEQIRAENKPKPESKKKK